MEAKHYGKEAHAVGATDLISHEDDSVAAWVHAVDLYFPAVEI